MEFMGTRAVSEATGLNEATLRYWRHTNQGPESFRLGRRVVYRRESVERWIAEQEHATRRGEGVTAVAQ